MKILAARVDWSPKFAAERPLLQLLIDRVPFEELRYRAKVNLYFAEHDGFCSYYLETPERDGFGRSKFRLTMVDGSEITLVGPWSSNASYANSLGFGPCMRMRYTVDALAYARAEQGKGLNGTPGTITIAKVRQCAHLIDVGDGFEPSKTLGGITFPAYSEFALARTVRANWQARVPDRMPDGTLADDVRAAIEAALAANDQPLADDIATRYARFVKRAPGNGSAMQTFRALDSYEPAVKAPGNFFWTKPC